MIIKSGISTTALLLALVPLASTHAQTATESPKPAAARPEWTSWPVHTYYLKSYDQANLNDVATVLRNAIGVTQGSTIVTDYRQNAIVIRENPADIPIIEKILVDIDRPRKSYRVTYTLSEMDNNKRIGTQHFAMVMVSGQQARLKQGSKVPVVSATTGTNEDHTPQTLVTYQDVGINLDAVLQQVGDTGQLEFNVEQSSIAPGTSGLGAQDPVLRVASLKGEATLEPGKPLMLGSIDFPDSTRRLDVEALMEPLP